jgi:hypothetical protein
VPHPDGKHYQPIFLCTNVACSDPVDASPLPCGLARKESILCGMQGKHYKKMEVAEPAKPEKKIIQLGETS